MGRSWTSSRSEPRPAEKRPAGFIDDFHDRPWPEGPPPVWLREHNQYLAWQLKRIAARERQET